MLSRRSFLHTLGIAAAGIAFRPKLDFLVPDNIVAYDGEANLRWLMAESVALLAAELPEKQFRPMPGPARLGAVQDGYQFGIQFPFDDDFLKRPKEEIREMYIRPAMGQLAQQVLFRKARCSFPLPLSNAMNDCARIRSPKNGLDLRFMRAWDIGHSWTDEETGKECFTPPQWRARFDMLIA